MLHIQINQTLSPRNAGNSTRNVITHSRTALSVNYVSNDEINRHVSQIIYGRIDDAFKPCHSEKDAWMVVGWMQAQHLWENGQLLSPRAICLSLIAQSAALEAV